MIINNITHLQFSIWEQCPLRRLSQWERATCGSDSGGAGKGSHEFAAIGNRHLNSPDGRVDGAATEQGSGSSVGDGSGQPRGADMLVDGRRDAFFVPGEEFLQELACGAT